MQSLLRWSIENSTPTSSDGPPQPRTDLNPEIIDLILGKPDAELMKEALAIAVDETRPEDDRVQALDEFEMLIESIDNANDLVKLHMWEPLQNLLTSPSSSDEIKTQVLWIIGTAVQNNPSAQNAYLTLSPVQTLISFLSPSTRSAKLRSKAVYALSGTLQHSQTAIRQLREADGWEAFKFALEDSDITVRRRTAFLLNALLIPTSPDHPTSSIPAPLVAPQGSIASNSTSVTLHPTASVATSDSSPNVQTPVHPNSHASMIADPTSASTSELTKEALDSHGLLEVLLNALTSPTPHGPDGEIEGDKDFEDKIVAVLYTYVTACQGRFSPGQADGLAAYVNGQIKKAGGPGTLAERWGLSVREADAFVDYVQRSRSSSR